MGRELGYGGSRPWRHCEVAPSRLPPQLGYERYVSPYQQRQKKASLRGDSASRFILWFPICFASDWRSVVFRFVHTPPFWRWCSPLRPCPFSTARLGTGRPTDRASFFPFARCDARCDVSVGGPATWVSQDPCRRCGFSPHTDRPTSFRESRIIEGESLARA